MDYARPRWKKIAPRLFRAAIGFWLARGPLVVFLIRWEWYEVGFIYLLLIAAFLFVGFKCWLDGPDYLKLLGADVFTALASLLIGGGASGALAKLTHYRLHSSILFLPLVIVAGFLIAEVVSQRRAAVAAPPAGGPREG